MTQWNWFSICLLLCGLQTLRSANAAGMLSAESRAAAKTKISLCPELGERSPYEIWASRYDNISRSCYKTGTRGPCGDQMIFYAEDEVTGSCDCNMDECRSLIYSHVNQNCVDPFTQGHCDEGYWLVVNQSGKAECQRNLCQPPPKYSAKYQWALYKGRCERLYKPIHDCKPDEYLWVPKGSRFPVCGKAQCSNADAKFVPDLQCEIGSKMFFENRCQRRKGI